MVPRRLQMLNNNQGKVLKPWMWMRQEVQLTGSTASSGRRPKAKARPRLGGETISNDLILIRYDTQHSCGTEVPNRRGAYLVCGLSISEIGPIDSDKVAQLVEELSDHRDRCLPQCGDRPRYAMDADSGRYVNTGYNCMADGVRGGIVDLTPPKGAKFVHRDWELVDARVPRT